MLQLYNYFITNSWCFGDVNMAQKPNRKNVKPKTSRKTPQKPKASAKSKNKKNKPLTKDEIRHNAAVQAWQTRRKNGWVSKPRTPKKKVPIIEVDDKKGTKTKAQTKSKKLAKVMDKAHRKTRKTSKSKTKTKAKTKK